MKNYNYIMLIATSGAKRRDESAEEASGARSRRESAEDTI